MSFFMQLLDYIIHLDKYLVVLIDKFGAWSYIILFFIIFLETGLVLTPFLPGDSLIFTVGSFTALGSFNLWLILVLLCAAAILGDTANYAIGHFLGPKIIKKKLIKQQHVERTQKYFDKYGASTIILARFIPIVRTFAPFMAGIGAMRYPKFLLYNFIGGILWICSFFFLGYFFGNLPFVKDNFSYFIIGVIVVSFIPLAIEYLRYRKEQKKEKAAASGIHPDP